MKHQFCSYNLILLFFLIQYLWLCDFFITSNEHHLFIHIEIHIYAKCHQVLLLLKLSEEFAAQIYDIKVFSCFTPHKQKLETCSKNEERFVGIGDLSSHLPILRNYSKRCYFLTGCMNQECSIFWHFIVYLYTVSSDNAEERSAGC